MEHAATDKAIITRGLRKQYGELAAVDGLDLEVPAGSLFGFLGPNGAGKSTTIRILTGLAAKTSGEVSVLGYDLDREPVAIKERIGVVPEELALFDRLTAAEYLTFVGRMYGVDKGTIAHRRSELLELMELPASGKKLIVDFSHGMKKKLAFAAAILHQPRLLFLDEPFEGIDAIASRMLKELMRQLCARGVTIFVTSHILEIVERLCSQIAIIHRGKLVAQGSLSELQRGVAVASSTIAAERATLEEIFLSLVEHDRERRPTLSWME